MQTLTADEFKKKYGVIAASQFDLDQKKQDQDASLFDSIKNDIANRAQGNNDILNQPRTGTLDNIAGGVQLAANTAGGITDVAGDILHKVPVVGSLIKGASDLAKSGFNAVTDKLAGTKFFQEAAGGLQPSNPLENSLQVAAGGGQIAGQILGADYGAGLAQKGVNIAKKVPAAVARTADSIPSLSMEGTGPLSKNLGGAIRDIIPTRQNVIDDKLAKALDVTQGDLANIKESTGNEIGTWMSEHNLIGTNKPNTAALIKSFFSQNYNGVRSAIDAIKTDYKPSQIPRLTDALKRIQLQVQDIPGLEKEAADIDNMLHQSTFSLRDVQTVKEKLDDLYNIYSRSGEVASGPIKQGLANIRGEIKGFIENEVKKDSGVDIRSMNNNVATAKVLGDAIERRSQRGLTRVHLSQRDIMMGMGLTYFGNPLFGVAAVFMKKIWESPSVRLQIARGLDKLNDAERVRISQGLAQGKVPKELETIVNSTSDVK